MAKFTGTNLRDCVVLISTNSSKMLWSDVDKMVDFRF